MRTVKDKVSLAAVIIVYLLFNFRYSPGNIFVSLKSTLGQILITCPFVIGLTILVVSFMQRSTGEKLPWDRIIRLYCTLGIIIGFFYALNEYWLSAN